MATKLQKRRDTAANWASVNPVLAQGEDGLELDTGKEKTGNGTTAWNLLPYKTLGIDVAGTAAAAVAAHAAAADPHPGYTLETDERLTDSRTPTSHKASHAIGGTDALSPADIGAATAAQGAKADSAVQPAGLTKAAVGLSDVDNTSDAQKPVSTAQAAALALKADLVNGLVPAAQLPGFTDDVVEYANLAAFPATGEAGKLYIALNTNKQYRWAGSTYQEINPSPGSSDAVPEGSVNLYHTTQRAAAAAPVQSVAGRTGVVTLGKGDVGLGNADNTSDADKPVSTAQANALALKADSTDARFSDARTPTSHKASHATGGSDALTPADIGAATAAQGAKADSAVQPADQATALASKADLVGGLVPSAQLPGFVDDVLEFANVAVFPATGEAGKLYISLATNRQYRWSGSLYVEINPSPGSTDAVPEGSVNLYFSNTRARAAISVSGSLAYDSATGIISYTAPTLATVATTGAYGDLSGRPTIPTPGGTSGQVQFNNAGTFAGTAGLAIDPTTGRLTLASFLAGSAPAAPANGFTFYAGTGNALSWIGANGFTRTFDGTANTANRSYTLQDKNGTVAHVEDTQPLNFTTTAITYAATTDLNFNVLTPATYNVLTLTGNVTFTLSNIAAGRELRIIVEAGAAQRTLGFPAALVFGGTKPSTIAANKRGFLTIACHGTTEASCSAAWAVQS